MSDLIIKDIEEFLNNADFTSYEISAYMSLLRSGSLTAREISERSGVPTGRIYEILDELNDRNMIEIQESRPKKYRALSFNKGFQNLIKNIENKNKNRISYLVNQAKNLEDRIYNSDFLVKREHSKLFWSTAFGSRAMFSLYNQKCEELQEELLVTGFINETTFRILRYAKDLYHSFKTAHERGVAIKYLWSFEHDERPLTVEQEEKNRDLALKMKKRFKEYFGIPNRTIGFQMKFIHKRLPTYHDIFDKERVIIKLLNPLRPAQVYGCINVLDINLAMELRKQYLEIWTLEAFE